VGQGGPTRRVSSKHAAGGPTGKSAAAQAKPCAAEASLNGSPSGGHRDFAAGRSQSGSLLRLGFKAAILGRWITSANVLSLLPLVALAGGVRVGAALLHPGSHLDLDAGVVLDRPAFGEIRADVRLDGGFPSRLVDVAGREVGTGPHDRAIEAESGAVGMVRTSDGSLARVRVHEVRGARGGVLAEKIDALAPISVRVEWEALEPGAEAFPDPARIRSVLFRDGAVEIEWDGAPVARIERRDEESGDRVVLAPSTASPFRDSTGREGGFYRYEVFRPLPGGGHAAPARAFCLAAPAGFHGVLQVEGARRTLDLARGLEEEGRRDVNVVGMTARGVHFSPGAGGAIGFQGMSVSIAPGDVDPGWTWNGTLHVEVGSSLLVRTPEGRHARVRVEGVERPEGAMPEGRVLFEFLPDFGHRFLDPPSDLSVAKEGDRVRLRWTSEPGSEGSYRVEAKRRDRFEAIAEPEEGWFEEDLGDRLLLEYRVVFRARDGRESLPSEPATAVAGEGPIFAASAIEALGDPDFFRREEAMGALRLLGPEVVPLLRAGTSSEDPEIAQRCTLLLTARELRMEALGEAAPDLPPALFAGDEPAGLRDRERRLLALIAGDLEGEARAFLAESDPDPLARRLAASERFGRRALVEDEGYASGPRPPYPFDRARFDRAGGPGAPWGRLGEEVFASIPRSSSRDAWLLRTVVEVLRDPAADPARLDRCELALRCLDGKTPGDADATAAAEAVLKAGFDLEKARALRLLPGGLFPPVPRGTGRVVSVSDEPSLRRALEEARAGDEIRAAAGEYGGEGALPFEIRVDDLRLAGEGERTRFLSPVRVSQARDVELRSIAIAAAQGVSVHAIEASVAMRDCRVESTAAGVYADRSDLLLEGCVLESESTRPQGGYGLHAQRGSFVAMRRTLVRGFGGAVYASSPIVIERCVLAGPGTSALHRTGEAFLVLHESVIAGFQRGLSEFATGVAVAVEFDRVERATMNLGEGFLVCDEDRGAFGLGPVTATGGASLADCATALQPR